MERWSAQRANEWYQANQWPIGFNYVTSNAVNSTEMWQNDTFDSPRIRHELALAASLGFNSCRVFLQFIVWENEREVFMKNLADFCDIAEECGLSVMPVLLDDCRFAMKDPYLGKQDAPRYGVSNGGWTPSPGFAIADDPAMEGAICAYVQQIIGAHRDNRQIIAWDL